jgi:hypothetical protein
MRSFVVLKGLVKEDKRNWVLKEGLSSFFLDIDNLRSLYFKPDYKGDRDYLVNSFDELVYSRFIEVVCTKASTGTLIVVDMENESTAILEQLARIFGYTVFYKVFPIPQDYVTKNRKYSDLRYIPHSRVDLKKEVGNFLSQSLENKNLITTYKNLEKYWSKRDETIKLEVTDKVLHVSDLHSHFNAMSSGIPPTSDYSLTVFHGDYIDGPVVGGSRKVMESILLCDKENVRYLEGNHELRLRKYLGWKVLKAADRKIAASCIYNSIPDQFLKTTAKEFETLSSVEAWAWIDEMNRKLKEYVIYKRGKNTYICTHCGIRWIEQLSPKFVGNLINSNKNIERVDEAFTKNYVRDKFYSIHAHCYYPSGFNPTKYSNVVNLDPEDENKVNYYVSEHKKNNKIVCLREELK